MTVCELIGWLKDKQPNRRIMWCIDLNAIRELEYRDIGLSLEIDKTGQIGLETEEGTK